MTTYNWSALTNNQIVGFVPGGDIINIDDAAISAASMSYSFTPTAVDTVNGRFTLTAGSKTVTFGIAVTSPAPFGALTATNIVFADGSKLIVGDGAVSTANDDLANTLTGSIHDDAFYGLGGNDTMSGGDGNDSFYAGYVSSGIGNDSINGGAGYDSWIYNSTSTAAVTVNLATTHTATSAQGTATLTSIETVLGTAGNDTMTGGDTSHSTDSTGTRITERFRGNSGNDSITGGSGTGFFTVADYANNTVAQAINVNLSTGAAADGRGGTDQLSFIDEVRGGAGNDSLTGGSLSRTVSGTFFEQFRGNGGNDTINGNNSALGDYGSSDRVDYSNNTASQAVNVNLGAGTVSDGLGGIDTLIDIELAQGGAGNDTLTGSALNDDLDGGRGNDTIDGGAESDAARFQLSTAGIIVNLSASSITISSITVAAGTANDGMGGTDTLLNIENIVGSDYNDYIRGSDDTSVINFFTGEAGNDTFDGGAGIDFAAYGNNATILGGLTGFIENGSGTINDKMGGTDTLINIEGLTGTNTNDTLTGGLGVQYFRGNGGSDSINGGADNDWVFYDADPTGTTINLASGSATDGYGGVGAQLGLGGTDILVSIENVNGSEFNDIITGSSVANILIGDLGADQINGGAGNDTIYYDAADVQASILGGADTDTLVVLGGAAPTSFNLTSHQFEKAEHRITDPGANAWTSYIDHYNASWQRTHQTGIMDDGRTFNEDYDELNNQTWVRITYWNDALARPDVETGLLDDGRFYDSDHDNGNLYSWTRIDYWRDALSRSDVETGFLDDGRTYNSDLDNGDAFVWLRIDNWADSLGRTDYQNGFYDLDDASRPGWTWQVDYDQANQFSWARVERFWNAAGVLQSETFF